MWTMNETRPLATAPAETSWVHPDLLALAADLGTDHNVTGTLTHNSVDPDDDGDFLGFSAALTSDVSTETITAGYVHRDDSPHARRAATGAEVLAEMAHAVAYGDLSYLPRLTGLLGSVDAKKLVQLASRHP